MAKKIKSLTGGVVPMFAWKLPIEIATYKVAKMPASQWINVIKGFAQKGVKGAEISDSRIMAHLESLTNTQVTREQLAEFASFSLPSIKEVNFSGADAKYKNYSWSRGANFKDYNETVFYFPTVVEDFNDRIDDLDEAISVFNFNPDLLGEDPDLVIRLDEKRQDFLRLQKEQIAGVSTDAAHASTSTHFSGSLTALCPDARADFTHMRWSVMDDAGVRTLFIHEMQSDWAQKGRQEAKRIQAQEIRSAINPFVAAMAPHELALVPRMIGRVKSGNKDPGFVAEQKRLDTDAEVLFTRLTGAPFPGAPEWKGHYKKAPLVSETEHWVAFSLRRAMFLAIENQCAQVTWINGEKMINGGGYSNDGADEFYMKIVSSIAQKLAKPFKSELVLRDFNLTNSHGNAGVFKLAVMPVTTEMREKLTNRATVYSHAKVVEHASFDPVRAEQLRIALQDKSNSMFGADQAMRVRIVSEILDACSSHRPAGALIGKIAEIAFGAEDPVQAMHHEGFHFACKYHFSSSEKEDIFRHFTPGTPLLARTVRLLMDSGNNVAALQCSRDPEEAAAHAFSLWKAGFMPVTKIETLVSDHVRTPVLRVIAKYFPQANAFIKNVASWIRATSASPTDFVARIVSAHEQGKLVATQAEKIDSSQETPGRQDFDGFDYDDGEEVLSPGAMYS